MGSPIARQKDRDRFGFFAASKKSDLENAQRKVIFRHEEHGLKKHVGGQSTGTRWLLAGSPIEELEIELESYLSKYLANFVERVAKNQIGSFDIVDSKDELDIKFPRRAHDYFKLQVSVWWENNSLIVSYHGYPYERANQKDLGLKELFLRSRTDQDERPLKTLS